MKNSRKKMSEFKLILTKLISEHPSERSAKLAMKKRRPRRDEMLVIIRHPTEETS